jgi:hypothetical protein
MAVDHRIGAIADMVELEEVAPGWIEFGECKRGSILARIAQNRQLRRLSPVLESGKFQLDAPARAIDQALANCT